MKRILSFVVIIFLFFTNVSISYANQSTSSKIIYEDIINSLTWEDFDVKEEDYNYVFNSEQKSIDEINKRAKEVVIKNYKYRKSIRYASYFELTESEMRLVKKYPAIGLVIRMAATLAENKTNDLYGRSMADDESDAFRHAYFNALMVKKIFIQEPAGQDIIKALDITKSFADAHEENSETLAKMMDLHNNEIGRNIAKLSYDEQGYFIDDESIAVLVKNAVDNGKTLKIVNDLLVPTNYKIGEFKNKWVEKDGKFYYYNAQGQLSAGWNKIDSLWYYFNAYGERQEGWQKISGNYYYLEPGTGIMQIGWKYINGNYYYMISSGERQEGWQKISGSYYYLEPGTGIMQTGWRYIDNNYFYFDDSGAMQTGWILVNGTYYYMMENGAMKEGWLYYNNKYYYLTPNKNGAMKTGWQYIDNNYFYFDNSGAMQTGWIYLDAYYYLNTGGQMQTGWKNIDGKTYYFGSDGRMVTGYVYINNVQYYFDSSGALSKSPGSGYNPNKPIIMLGVKKDGVELNV